MLSISQIPLPSTAMHSAQQLCVQHKIQEQVQSTSESFATLAKQMQQLISTSTAAAIPFHPPTPRPRPVTSQFHEEEPCDIYIPNETLPETEPALVFSSPPVHIKPKAPSTSTLNNNEFSHTTRSEDEISCTARQRWPMPLVNPFGFSDYPPDDYYDHPQPWYQLPRTSHQKEDSQIKTIANNMHLLAIGGSTTNKCLLHDHNHNPGNALKNIINPHKFHTHNTEDCVWLKWQNAQWNNGQDSGCQSHATQPSTINFCDNSNDICGQYE
uniref:Uncharacterized protein n=1 Tax=Romanomermis culicivorax TaxID=13658 RepID=A0A915L715_ROMCU